ncbi:MAG: OmpA family protein [Bacteroidales bacterium]|jgi:OmpA-OmpF porin, OOP family|nr:OmpA family protein [Bacteroidales bacterium]
MKQVLMIVTILGLVPATSQAQSILHRLERTARTAAERTVERKVEEKVEEGVSKAVEKAIEEKENEEENKAVTTGKSDKDKPDRSSSRRAADNQNLEFDDWDLEDQDKEMVTSGQAPASASPQSRRAAMEWAKSDFVAGDVIFFEDNLAGEKLGEYPSRWDVIEGNAEIVRVDGENAIMLLNDARIAPFMSDQQRYLPEDFTLEFDFYLAPWEEAFEETGEYPFSDYILNMFSDYGGEWDTVTMQVVEMAMDPRAQNLLFFYHSGSYDHRDASLDHIDYHYGGWVHFALSFNKRALKVYLDGVRVINLPNVAAPLRFEIGQGWGIENTWYIRNIRLAKGAVPLYDRMMQDGKFISYGITFDVAKSIIKPESAGELNRIVQLMQENPSLRFSVEGHTDATGSAPVNQKLSEARAEAVVARLVEMGIDRSRLSARGFGQNTPIADNSTDEGRAKNRRVEFVKL